MKRSILAESDGADHEQSEMAKRPRIAVVGSANVDLTTFSDRFPKPGETIFGEKFDLGFGGKGANQAVAARLCGSDAFMVARVGDDLFGPATIANFEKLGIDPTHVRIVRGVSSGVAPIFVESSGQNRIIVVKGANDTLKPADVKAAAEMLKSADCIVLQFEIPLQTVYYTIHFARKNGIRCILNPAPHSLPALQIVVLPEVAPVNLAALHLERQLLRQVRIELDVLFPRTEQSIQPEVWLHGAHRSE